MDLTSSIMEALTSDPFSLARDFCSEPRWSLAAAAITPRLFETAFIPASFPGVSFTTHPPQSEKPGRAMGFYTRGFNPRVTTKPFILLHAAWSLTALAAAAAECCAAWRLAIQCP